MVLSLMIKNHSLALQVEDHESHGSMQRLSFSMEFVIFLIKFSTKTHRQIGVRSSPLLKILNDRKTIKTKMALKISRQCSHKYLVNSLIHIRIFFLLLPILSLWDQGFASLIMEFRLN